MRRTIVWKACLRGVLISALLGALCLPATAAATPVSFEIKGSSLRLRTTDAELKVRTRRLGLRLKDRNTRKTVLRDERKGGLFYERGGQEIGLREATVDEILPDGVRLSVETDEDLDATVTLRFLTPKTLQISLEPANPSSVEFLGGRLRSPRSELIYGLTERLRDSPPLAPPVIQTPVDDIAPPEVGSLNRRGEVVEMLIRPTFSLYAPFFHSSKGYGLSVAGTTIGAFDLASTSSRTLSFRFEAGTRPVAGGLVFHVFLGPEHTEILDEYTQLTGRPFVPPDWAFLNWRWRGELPLGESALLDGVLVNADVAEDVLRYEEFGIPPGVYLFDRPVQPGNYGLARFEWDEARLPNPTSMLQSLVSRGYTLAIWSSTWTCGTNPGDNGSEAAALGYLAPQPPGPPVCSDLGGTSFILDPTNIDAYGWWRDKIAAFLAANGIRGIKLDRGEEHIPTAASDIWADGRTGREVRNAYPSLQAQLHHNALAQAHGDNDFVVMSRPGYTGTQQWGVFWGGDIPASETFGAGPGTDLGLRSAIISQQRAAFMGFPIWGSDTGGYYEFKDREVFARWIEFSCFSGLMEIGGVGTHAPWDMPTTPNFDTEMIEIYRYYTVLRHTLQPYIVAAAQDAGQGVPLVRPMPFFDRKDKQLQDRWDQYMFGPDLLVAPVWKVGERKRRVYFPKGTWRNYFAPAEVYKGKKEIEFDVDLDEILVFVRDGAVVPGP